MNETTPINIRPWGRYDILETGVAHQVKRITVEPHYRLSLQFHHFRVEHWIVVSGQGLMTLVDQEFQINPGSYVCVPVETLHRVECISDEPLVFIEVWTGSLLNENDIVRVQDDYARVASSSSCSHESY
ncbi:MAG: Mannose-6-phosphate isomerase [Candidatus Uhrbacteria bacterium GW2011_GWF2_41_16]|jgi:mannose-1-phosphate guanylyltransferase|uniref:Mannose-6-phosphate isomerase n=2 Tax=Candidatus Uhriibacteriota TaxID=1752732 RepID=A0A0G0XLZ3_9BACT|nr:MAG: Mannose-6-phosphate isomerase [Candidatus Uhrbacteria bacterium GW2011_GWC2_41_11]KKR97810.1 MAG: Mannose-6-phosphate isomerase [Candidatus Uhrbacteria bacterium GW2011_GWF2_41_16]HBP00526.1 mannose-6-phosphate isomerase [Candidatus Uhrbacteria bacterium]